MREIARSALETVRHQIEARGQRLALELGDESIPVDADPLRLEQIVSNLLSNATKYTPNRGRIRVGVAAEGEHAVVRVADDGAGIPSDVLPLLFRGHAGADSLGHGGGLGLGLRVVRELVDLHGGSVEGASEGPGLGSVFTVRLPLADGPPEADDEKPDPIAQPSRRVLVIEDDPDVADTLEEILRRWGHEVFVARDGAAGLSRAHALAPEIVLIDIGLPDVSGYDLARSLRDASGANSALLIAITGYGRPQDREQAHHAGFDHHITKPDVLPRLRELLNQS